MNCKGRNWLGSSRGKAVTKTQIVVTQSKKGQLTDQAAQAYKIIQITKEPIKTQN